MSAQEQCCALDVGIPNPRRCTAAGFQGWHYCLAHLTATPSVLTTSMFVTEIDEQSPIQRSPMTSQEDLELLNAIKVLNAWARSGRNWYSGQVEVTGPEGEFRVALVDDFKHRDESHHADTPEAAQVAAANALVADHPRLSQARETATVARKDRAERAHELIHQLGAHTLAATTEAQRAFNLKLIAFLAEVMAEGGL